ncbi:hypothetical protein BCR34DRAFT_549408 [Clohesyomyces aquaticus]|uniref:Tat pathway signal sequence n=1 Tax=Clohesyomyces aquaticus TaxID=1231657 RepID=A0A1Y1YF62_9PLEO|nr:hypothetical protein BCR34DRAFT_549408 [Clohesyomyces aquaticus]
MNEQKEALLTDWPESDASQQDNVILASLIRQRRCLIICLAFSHILFFFAILFSSVFRIPKTPDGESNIYSPARSAIKHTIKNDFATNHSHYGLYNGVPNKENDDSWRQLVKPTYFSVREQEMESANMPMSDAIQLEEGGYLGALAVYHQLHCLRRLRVYLYKEAYYNNDDLKYVSNGPMDDYTHAHLADHCIEALRLLVMCRGDVSLYTFTWAKEYPDATKNILSRVNSSRQCVNWENLESWARERAVPWNPRLVDPNGEIVVGNS